MADNARIKELTSVLEKKTGEMDLALKSIKVEGENVHVPQETADRIRGIRSEVNEIKGLLTEEYLGDEIKQFTKGFDPEQREEAKSIAMQRIAQQAGDSAMQVKSLGENFVSSDEFKSFQKTGRATMDTPFEMDAHDVTRFSTYGQKDVYNGMPGAQHTISHGFGRIQYDPMVPRGQRPTRVRDLFPVATTSANLIDYFRVLGFVENGGNGGAAPVADRTGTAPNDVFGMKPKSNLQFQSAQAPVRTIAHWEAAHRNVISDEPQLRSTIDNELLYGLALVEDDQILNGDGNGENLLGLLNVPGTLSYTQQAGELKSDALRRAATKAILAYYPPTGYVIHPYDWEDVELQKGGSADSTNGGDGQYMLVTNVSVGAQQRVWRQPVVESPAIAEGTFATGAWGTGAQLYDRERASVRIAEQHADFFVRNAVAILVEERLAFAVKRPESFVIGEFV